MKVLDNFFWLDIDLFVNIAIVAENHLVRQQWSEVDGNIFYQQQINLTVTVSKKSVKTLKLILKNYFNYRTYFAGVLRSPADTKTADNKGALLGPKSCLFVAISNLNLEFE
jgi:hypothetical protein